MKNYYGFWNRQTDEVEKVDANDTKRKDEILAQFEPEPFRRHVAWSSLFVDGQRVDVSTAFLVINHGWFGDDKYFETMIFGGKFDGYQDRYPTAQLARDGHQSILTKILSGKLEREE